MLVPLVTLYSRQHTQTQRYTKEEYSQGNDYYTRILTTFGRGNVGVHKHSVVVSAGVYWSRVAQGTAHGRSRPCPIPHAMAKRKGVPGTGWPAPANVVICARPDSRQSSDHNKPGADNMRPLIGGHQRSVRFVPSIFYYVLLYKQSTILLYSKKSIQKPKWHRTSKHTQNMKYIELITCFTAQRS